MENIKKQIYTLPEIRKVTKPLWTGWAITIIGAVCGIIGIFNQNISAAASTDFICVALVGVLSLILTLCYYLFGDSRRPYHKGLHTILEPTLTYYAPSMQQQLTTALESKDEKALARVKKSPHPELVLYRYSDKAETIFYSQLLQMNAKQRMEPVSDLYINNINS